MSNSSGKIDDRYGYINVDGIIIDTKQYCKARNFENNQSVVQTSKGYQIIDTDLRKLTF